MSNELTQPLPPSEEDRSTQPTITAVFELIQNVKQVVDNIAARQNDLEVQIQNIAARQTGLELQIQNVKQVVDSIAARQNDLELQIKTGLSTLSNKIDILNRARLTTEADHASLLQRIEELESKGS